jgi:hypothetical protein
MLSACARARAHTHTRSALWDTCLLSSLEGYLEVVISGCGLSPSLRLGKLELDEAQTEVLGGVFCACC